MPDEPAATTGERAWVSDDHYRLLSVPFLVRTTEEDFAEAIRWHLAPFLRRTPQQLPVPIDVFPGDRPSVYCYESRRTDGSFYTGSWGEVLEYALWDIHSFVPAWAQDFVFIHAGAVAREDRALLVPAQRDTGKSTLVTALLQAGFGYLSDEAGAIDPVTARAYPFEKRIWLDPESLPHFPGLEERLRGRQEGLTRRYVRPEDLGASVAPPAEVRWLVFPTMDREGAPRLSPLAKAEAVERMAAACFNLYRYGERGVILLARVAAEAEAFLLEGGAPRERAAAIADRFG